MEKDKYIYHYCSVDTFMAIIQNKTLRLSDLNKTNDYMEKKWANRFIIDVFMEQIEQCAGQVNLEADYWYDKDSNTLLQHYKHAIESVLYNENPILITCFSEEKDKLSQWRAYAEDGRGIAIGFNYSVVEQLKCDDRIYVEKVVYEEFEQEGKLGELIKDVIFYMEDIFRIDMFKTTTDFNIYFRKEFDSFYEKLAEYIGEAGCTIKNPAFKEEKEVRIIYNRRLPDKDDKENGLFENAKEYFKEVKKIKDYKINPLSFSNKNNQLIAFCDIDFSKLVFKSIINEIIIGPKSQLNERDIYYFLMANGFNANDITISKSEATYR